MLPVHHRNAHSQSATVTSQMSLPPGRTVTDISSLHCDIASLHGRLFLLEELAVDEEPVCELDSGAGQDLHVRRLEIGGYKTVSCITLHSHNTVLQL